MYITVKILAPLTDITDHKVQKNFKKKLDKICRLDKEHVLADKDVEIVKILAPLKDNLFNLVYWDGSV